MVVALTLVLLGAGLQEGPVEPDVPPHSGSAAAPTDPRYAARAETERVLVRADWAEGELIERLAAEVERALPIFARATGATLPPGERLVLNLFATREAYLEISQADGAAPTPATGLTLTDNSESYVVVQPTREPAYLAAVGGLPDGLFELVLHEAVHQFVMRAHPSPERALPGWYVEGRAEYLTRLALRELLGPREASPLCLATSTNKVALAIDDGAYMPLDVVLGTTFEVPRTMLFYEQAESLYAYLHAEDSPYRERFLSFEAWLSEQMAPADTPEDPFHGPLEGIEARWRACIGTLERFERDWAAASRARDGEWHEMWRHSQWVGDELVCASNHWTTFSLALNNERPRRDAFTLEARLAFLYGHSACVVLGMEKEPLSFFLVELTRAGELTLSEFADGAWTPLASSSVGERELGAWTPIEVRVRGASVSVRVGEGEPVEAAVAPGRRLGAGFWGVGTQQAGVRYRGITLR